MPDWCAAAILCAIEFLLLLHVGSSIDSSFVGMSVERCTELFGPDEEADEVTIVFESFIVYSVGTCARFGTNVDSLMDDGG